MFDLELMRRLSAGVALIDSESEGVRARDYDDGPRLAGRAPKHPVPALSDEEIAALISIEARDLVIGFEVTSEAYYKTKYERPITPGGTSGITVGIGYDLGYNGPDDVRRDFAGLIAPEHIESMVEACGLRGDEARRRRSAFSEIRVPWDAAIQVFQRTTMPRFGRLVLHTFPNAVELKGHAFGALFSLVFNRGASLEGDKRREMRAIRDLMAERAFAQIPAQFREMKRLWKGQPDMAGLLKRRDAEAMLFERGLELMSRPMAVASTRYHLEGAGLADRQARIEALHYEIGLYAEAARRTGSPVSESDLKSLSAAHLELGFGGVKSIGAKIAQELERQLQACLCGNGIIAGLVDRDGIRQQVDEAARKGTAALRECLVGVLALAAPWPIVRPLIDKVVDVVFEKLVMPAAGERGTVVIEQIDRGAEWLCQCWSERISGRDGEKTVGGRNGEPTVDPVVHLVSGQGAPTPTDSSESGLSTSGADTPKAVHLLHLIEQAAAGPAPDTAGVRRYIRALRDHLKQNGNQLTPEEHERFLDILCDTRFMEQISGAVGADPYAIMGEIEKAAQQRPIDRAAVATHVRNLHGLISDARMKLQPAAVGQTLKALRSARLFDELTLLADRFVTRDPGLLALVSPLYAQGLVDSGRIVAAIEVLHAALEHATLTKAETAEANGLLGRCHKQIYVNHVRSQSDAVALRDTLGLQLEKAIDRYGLGYDPARPDANYWHGINYIALLKRAERDRIPIGDRPDPDDLARSMIAALEPLVKQSNDFWMLAALGQSYLAIGEHENAGKYFGAYARHENIDAFALNGTVRQLEEVWQI